MNKKNFMKYALPFIIVLFVSIGIYYFITDRNTSVEKLDPAVEEELNQEQLVEEENEEELTEEPSEGQLIDETIPEEEVKENDNIQVDKDKVSVDKDEDKEKIQKEKVEDVSKVPVAPEKDLASVIANAKSYVYTIDTDLEQGSGFLFNAKGDIVTSAHVAKDASYVTVTNSDGQQFDGQVIGISKQVDIALIRVPELVGKQPMAMELALIKVGTNVFALGSPENIANTSTEGKILSLGKNFFEEYEYKNLYEMDATIKKGSSGGPLIDAETERILGINSIVLQDNPRIGYAIPIYTVINQLNEWASNPIVDEEPMEEDWDRVEEAYFAEDLLSTFIVSYYELIPYSLNDAKLDYYVSYLLPGSQADEEGKRLVASYREDLRVFDAVKSSIKKIEIGEEEAKISADAIFMYHNQENDDVYEIKHEAVYTVVIDEYGDYQIKHMVVK